MSSFRSTVVESLEVAPRKTFSLIPFHLVDDWTLAFYLGLTGKTFWYAITHREQQYTVSQIPKASGGVRTIHNPSPLMRVIGQLIRYKILAPLCAQLGPHVTAYRQGHSTLDAAKRHLAPCAHCASLDLPHTCGFEPDASGHVRKINGATCPACQPVPAHNCPRERVKVHLDLKDFFGSTRESWVRQYFHLEVGFSHYVSGLLASLLTVPLFNPQTRQTHAGVPQGGKASGDITNLVANWLLDKPILATLPAGWTYSRYADDLYFSFSGPNAAADVGALLSVVKSAVRKSGYRLNDKKTSVQRPHKQQRLLGIVVNKKINISKGAHDRMRAILHHCLMRGFSLSADENGFATPGELCSWIEGTIGYYEYIAPKRGRALRARYNQAVAAHPTNTSVSFVFKGAGAS